MSYRFPPIEDSRPVAIRKMQYKKRTRVFERLMHSMPIPVCHWCGIEVIRQIGNGRSACNTATLDHVVDQVSNGDTTMSNCVIACFQCNQRRSRQTSFAVQLNRMRTVAPNRLFGCIIKFGEAI